MNKQMVSELLSKVMDANESGSHYNFRLDVDEHGFNLRVFATHSKLFISVWHCIASYDGFDKQNCEKALNYAHMVMNDFARNGDNQLNTGIRLGMAADMVQRMRYKGKDEDIAYVAEYFDLDEAMLEGAVNGLTA